ncbi:MAG: CotH kinase family protein [Bacteroidales bacterium]|nr:CotH kinase family protein [Bacteroidales bacterium]
MKTLFISLVFIVSVLSISNIIGQEIVLNEVMTSNKNTIIDEDGDTPDWIEIINKGSETISLQEYGLTDNIDDPLKWVFPEIEIEANAYLLVFASGKDKIEIGGHWETIINWGDEWKYLIPESELPENWNKLDFNDVSWLSGPSGIGFGDDDDATIIPSPCISVFIRKKFTVEDFPEILSGVFHVDYDDAFVAYLNGVEIARANIGTPGNPPAYNETAIDSREALIYQGGLPELYVFNPDLLFPDTNVLAIQVHNLSFGSQDMSIIPFLTFYSATPPPNPSGSPEILQLPVLRLHTNFKLSGSGETVCICNPSGQILDSIQTGILPMDISFGRKPDGSDTWMYFLEATPEQANTSIGFPGITGDVQFSVPGGFYLGNIEIELSVEPEGAIIYFTLDGSTPDVTSNIYSLPLQISETTVLNAIACYEGFLPGNIATQTYFIDANHELPVISLSTNPENFFDPEIGIYHENNVNEDWERPVHLELFEPDGNSGFSIDAGVKLYGGLTTANLPQKSLAIFARDDYGYDEIDYQIFPDIDITKFESIVLRNSGNDWMNTMFRDGFMTELLDDMGIDKQAFRPALIYINGEYWGIHNIREKISDNFLEAHHGVESDELDLLEGQGLPITGNSAHYNNMIEFIENNSLSNQTNFEYIKTQMDVCNFINYQISQIYFANTDWPGNNIKFWRPKTPEGKWKWIIYDTDFGFGLEGNYYHNTLEFATEPLGPQWPNPPWSTFLLRKLLENNSFKIDFINRYADLLNSNFKQDYILSQINQKIELISEEMPKQFDRWGSNMTEWLNNINVVTNFANNRNLYVKNHVVNYFNLSGFSEIELNVIPETAGKITISSLALDEFPWTGEYFNDIPVVLSVEAEQGYEFKNWEGDIFNDSLSISLIFNNDMNITAVFQEIMSENIVINEINYHSADDFDPKDWVEFTNSGETEMDLSNWYFKDEDDEHIFTFPGGTVLEPNGFLVLCEDTSAFLEFFPEVENFIGNMEFGFSGNNELLRLYDPTGVVADTVHYDDEDPWPTPPDGNGPTLELINPHYDNALAESWAASDAHGTPGEINSVFVESGEQQIVLSQGFSFVSTRIIHNDPDFLVVLEPILNENLIYVRNSIGNTFRKIGPNWVNGIGDWNTKEGYLFKMTEDEQLNFEGAIINPLSPIALKAGFQFISYLPEFSGDGLEVFENILNDNLIYIRDSQGGMIRKIGPNWINGLGNANPGEGFLIKMSSDDTLVYNVTENTKGLSNEKPFCTHFNFEGGNPAEPVYTLYISGLEIGDEVAAFDDNKMVGAMKISSNYVFDNELPVFSALYAVKGYFEGNPIKLKVWKAETNKIENADFVMENICNSYIEKVYPSKDGQFSLVDVKNSAETKEKLITIYPNPAENFVKVFSPNQINNISIFNYFGNRIYHGNSTKINTENFETGVYIIRVEMNEGVEIQKFSVK